MSSKAKLSQMHQALSKPDPKEHQSKEKKGQNLEANPVRGERGDFLKLTITMPAQMLLALRELGLKRKAAGQKDTDTSALIREAVAELLKGN